MVLTSVSRCQACATDADARRISPLNRMRCTMREKIIGAGLYQKTLSLADEAGREFKLEPCDALHGASALLGNAQYFLSCDDGVTKRFKKRPLSVTIKKQDRSLEVLNPEDFIDKTGW